MKYRKVLVGVLILLGIVVRYIQFTSDRPLWVDEAMLTVNILNRSYRELLIPLDYEQQAPIGFLLVEKWLTNHFGIGERILRLFPFVASIGSLVLMAILSIEVLPYTFSLISLLLFVLSAPLIYYASEVKPYALDLTVGLMLTVIALQLYDSKGERKRRLFLILFGVGIVGLWFSQASTFILAGIGITGVIESLRKTNKRAFLLWVLVSLGWSVSFGVQSSLTLGQYYARYREVWQYHYAPFPPSTIVDFRWYLQTAIDVIRRPGGISLWPIAIVAFCIGCWYLAHKKWRIFLVLLLPGILAFIASTAHYYPFTGRFLLFWTPALLICIATGFWIIFTWSWSRKWVTIKAMSVVMVVAVLWNVITIGIYRIQNPERFEVITPLIRHYLDNRVTGDTLYLYYGAAFAFDYYARRYSIDPNDYIKGIDRTSELFRYTEDLQKIDRKPRVWVLFSHIYNWAGIDEEKFFVNQLNRMGKGIDEMHTEGASLYLYDLSN